MKIFNTTIKVILTILTLFFVQIYAQKKFVVVLDAGHGGKDFGARRYYDDLGNVIEKEIALSVTLKVGKLLEKHKDYKIIYTRKIDEYPSLTDRTNLANRSKADLFVSIHCNAARNSEAFGTETFVQGPNQNRENLEVAKAENDVIYLDEKDRETFASYNPSSPESLIALKIQQSKYLESSLLMGSFVESNFTDKDKRFSRGVKQDNLHVLRRNAMPSVLIELGFVSNYSEAAYLIKESNHDIMAESIYNSIVNFKKKMERNVKVETIVQKPAETPLKNDFRVLLFSSATKYVEGDPAFKGLKYILPIKEGTMYRYYYSTTNLASIRDQNTKTAKDAGFRNAYPVGFVPNQAMAQGFYTLEVAASNERLSRDHHIFSVLKDVERNKIDGVHYYTYGKFKTLEEALKVQDEINKKGVKHSVVQKNQN